MTLSFTFDNTMLGQFNNAFNVIFTLIAIVLAIMLLSYIIEWVIFKIYVKCANEKIQNAVTKIIYKLDEAADDMSNKEKRQHAIDTVKDLFIWRSIPLPSFVVGIIIDCSVSIIRSLQKNAEAYKNPYLHPDDDGTTNNPMNTNQPPVPPVAPEQLPIVNSIPKPSVPPALPVNPPSKQSQD